ncbi:hypothetical protein [Enterobacter cloacae]|uniref:hypothetical protein n=1 Tax=Enterobacter TaxID=547 RepID=UPI002B1F7C10|nr:hypothetical protein [Enterobacter cloacae]MEA5217008.1 hypothetical protein [Enterobacter cloacae]
MSFRYALSQYMEISVSGESGHIKSRTESISHCNQYLLHYLAADGQIKERWFDEDDLAVVEEERSPDEPLYKVRPGKPVDVRM